MNHQLLDNGTCSKSGSNSFVDVVEAGFPIKGARGGLFGSSGPSLRVYKETEHYSAPLIFFQRYGSACQTFWISASLKCTLTGTKPLSIFKWVRSQAGRFGCSASSTLWTAGPLKMIFQTLLPNLPNHLNSNHLWRLPDLYNISSSGPPQLRSLELCPISTLNFFRTYPDDSNLS